MTDSSQPGRIDSAVPLLTAAEERAATPEQLVTHNLRLVPYIARRELYRNRGLSDDDLIGIGNLYLVIAARGWNPDAGVRFASYAGEVIKSGLLRAIHTQGRHIRIPVWLEEMRPALRRAEAAFVQAHGRPATTEELAAVLGWKLRHVETLVTEHAIDSLDAEAMSQQARAREGDGRSRHEIIPAPDNPARDVERSIVAERVQAALDALPERTRLIVLALYPMDGTEPMTMRDAAKRFRLSHERIRQIKEDGLRFLKEHLSDLQEDR